MRLRGHTVVVAVATVLALAIGEPRAGSQTDPPPGRDLLGAIDFAPARADLDAAMSSAIDELIAIAIDPGEDAGVRLRAIRALAHYPGDPAKTTLLDLIADLAAARAGSGVLHLRAAIESLAEIGGPEEVDDITPFLDAQGSNDLEGLDLRTTAAKALGHIGAPTAVQPLRSRYNVEQSEQVKFAITEALRAILGS